MPYSITTSLMQGWKHNFNAIDTDHRPSWKNHGTGFAELDITSHKDRPYLSFHVTEHSEGNSALYPDGGRGSKREVFVQFDEHEGRRLYEWMKTLYEKGE